MDASERLIPPGPSEAFGVKGDLLDWMGRQFKTFGDTYKASVYGVDVYATRNAECAQYVLVENWQNYVKGQSIQRVALLLGNGLMVTEGGVWKRQRRMIQPAFSHDSVGALTKLIAAVNTELLKKWQGAAEKKESVNVTRDVSRMSLEVVLRFIFGDDYELAGPPFDLLSQEKTRDMAFARSFRDLGKVILQVIEQRRKRPAGPTTDALGVLLQARDPQSGQPMPHRQVIDEVFTLIVAGHETTASTLGWTWYLLSQHPEVEQRLAEEIDSVPPFSGFGDLPKFVYTRQIADETMRLYPAAWLMTRRALRDDQLGGYFLPAGTEVHISPFFLHRHPDTWEEPDRFDPDRFRPENSRLRQRLATMPFSAGPRQCIGTLFARVEMQIHLLTIFRHLRLRYIPSVPVELDAGVNLRGKHDFIMHPEAKT